jgi:hypothetical protein
MMKNTHVIIKGPNYQKSNSFLGKICSTKQFSGVEANALKHLFLKSRLPKNSPP